MYKKVVKPVLDKILALMFVILFWWLYIVLAILVRVKLGSPILFAQERPGMIDPKTGKERIFKLYKFRTMTDERDENGNLLPDEKRLTKFGKFLRATSLDEIPEIPLNILFQGKNAMSVVGPRPQLVKDMVFMTDEQRKRHTVAPGITGLAQIKGRNSITWEEKVNWDIKYVDNISFITDLKIIIESVLVVFGRNGVTDGEHATALDYGDALLKEGKITKKEYEEKQELARQILEVER
ncbi:MAG: sugar transferase [Firmicutes bacterium]|nr:sugar transferase [Bacillota bacterium]